MYEYTDHIKPTDTDKAKHHVVCLQCLTLARPVCKCGNVGVLIDVDRSIHIYVDDIRTCRLADVVIYEDQELDRQLLKPFEEALYVQYKPLTKQHLNFQPYSTYDYQRKQKDVYDKKLMAILDKYEHVTAAERRIGTTKQQPKITRKENL